jgi:bile acid:Na+ symporter, BASS family
LAEIDQVRLAFDPATLQILNVVLGLVLFGVALDLKVEHFVDLVKSPRAPLVGLVAQFVLLPAFAFGVVSLLDMAPSLQLGVLLVAACPGGNISNFLTHLARGNTAVSVGMTMVSTAAAIVTTPLNLTLWGSLDPDTAELLRSFALDPLQMLFVVAVLLGIPLAAGMATARYLPKVAARLRRPFKWLSIVFFVAFIALAFRANFDHFLAHVTTVFLPVLVLNTGALLLGFGAGTAARLPFRDRRAVTLEVGIQNSGLGLILIFNFFDGLGGMAIVAAWWGIWHVVAGLSLASLWGFRRYAPAR